MAEHAIYEEEITSARSEIENLLWRHSVEANVLNAANIHFQEPLGFDIFRPVTAPRHSVSLLKTFQLRLINSRHQAADGNWPHGAPNCASEAYRGGRVAQLPDFSDSFMSRIRGTAVSEPPRPCSARAGAVRHYMRIRR